MEEDEDDSLFFPRVRSVQVIVKGKETQHDEGETKMKMTVEKPTYPLEASTPEPN